MSCQHYADDTVLYISHRNEQTLVNNINTDLAATSSWCIKNKLSLNAKKTKQVSFGSKAILKKSLKPKTTIANETIKSSQDYKYLGFTLDKLLTFKQHVSQLKRNICHKTYMLGKIRVKLSEDAACKVLKNMILPTLDYGDCVYCIAPGYSLKSLQTAFNKGIKSVCYKVATRNVDKMHSYLSQGKLDMRREMHIRNMAFDYASKPENIDTRAIGTRLHANKMVKIPRVANNAYRKSLNFRLASSWNKLQGELRGVEEREAFIKESKIIYDETIDALLKLI